MVVLALLLLLVGDGDLGMAFACGRISGMQVFGSERVSPSLEPGALL